MPKSTSLVLIQIRIHLDQLFDLFPFSFIDDVKFNLGALLAIIDIFQLKQK